MNGGRYFSVQLFVVVLQLSLHIVRGSDLPVVTGEHVVKTGEPVQLTCSSSEPTILSIEWLKIDGDLSSDVDLSISNTLYIASVDHNHAGSYVCIVRLESESLDSAPFNLTVQYFEGHISVCSVSVNGKDPLAPSMPVYDLRQYDGMDVQFNCCTGAAEPAPVVSWFKTRGPNSDLSRSISEGSSLNLNSLNFHSRGMYECRAKHPTGDQSHSIYVVTRIGDVGSYDAISRGAQVGSVCGRVGGMAVIPCNVSGDIFEMDWKLNEIGLNYSETRYSFQGNKLVIYELQSNENGLYRCSVRGSEHANTETIWTTLCYNCISSVSITNGSQVTIGVDSKLVLNCQAQKLDELKQDLRYHWKLPNGTTYVGQKIELNAVKYSDDGLFTCTVENDFAMPISDSTRVSVEGPLLVTIEPSHPAGKLNHTLSMKCSTNSTSTSFVWTNASDVIAHDNMHVSIKHMSSQNSSILTINKFAEFDVSAYACEVHSNIHDKGYSRSFNVTLSNDIYLLWELGNPAGIQHTTLTIVCPVAGGRDGISSTEWLRNSTPIPTNDVSSGISTGTNSIGQPQLSINSLHLNHEYDNYTCVAFDSMGARFSESFTVFVEIPAEFKNSEVNSETVFANIGETVVFECEVMGRPMPKITWHILNTRKMSDRYENFTNGSFRIQDFREEDVGNYVCLFRWKDIERTRLYRLERQLVSSNSAESTDSNSDSGSDIFGLEQSIFIAIAISALGGIFLLLALVLCFCLICCLCCCRSQSSSEVPRIALETTSFERKPSLRGSYRFKDNSGILGRNTAANSSGMFTFQSDKGNSNSIQMTTASSVGVSPGPPIPSPVPTTPAGPTTSMVTAPEFQLPENVKSFPRQNLQLDNVMGEGEFGPVFKGIARNIIKGEVQSFVAVKVLIPREGENLWPSLMEFANQMKLSSPCIASILGICSDCEPYYVIYDYLDKGDLKQFLANSRPTTSSVPSLIQSELLQIVSQVAKGMSYLYKQQIIHGDLATRNCLIGSDLTIKIADLGIGHDLYPEDYYDNGAQLLPLRWMAPELFTNSEEGPSFSLASDVWSFGIFCWETFSYARQPYDTLSDQQVLQFIPSGNVLGAPEEGCPPLLFALMQECWAANPGQRPIFTEITSHIFSINDD